MSENQKLRLKINWIYTILHTTILGVTYDASSLRISTQ